MKLPTVFLDIKRVLERLLDLDDLVNRSGRTALELRELVKQHHAHAAELKQLDPTFVYVLPPTGAMMAQRAFVRPGSTGAVNFEPYVEIPAGTWIVVVGPAVTQGVKIGNQFQSSMSDYQGQVCQTKDVAQIGHRITVELRG